MVLERFSKRTWFALWIFAVALVTVVATYAYTQRRSITREEAIEVSTNSEWIQSIQHIIDTADWCNIKAVYMNTTRIHELKEANPKFYDFMPITHGVWKVEWNIGPSNYGPGIFIVVHFIDEKSGIILHENGIIL